MVRLQCSHAGHLVFSGCLDGGVRVWDVRGGECVREWLGHTRDILDLALARYMYIHDMMCMTLYMSTHCPSSQGWAPCPTLPLFVHSNSFLNGFLSPSIIAIVSYTQCHIFHVYTVCI